MPATSFRCFTSHFFEHQVFEHQAQRFQSIPKPSGNENRFPRSETSQSSSAADAVRIQQSWLAAPEKSLLLWIAARTPECIKPDHLTLLGLVAQIGAGVCYVLSRWNAYGLLGAIVCIALNWLGDSLDGTLSRFRQHLRPRYGYYVDHMVDSFGAVALMGGLGLSGYMNPWIAMELLLAFLMLSIQSYLATQVFGEFRLSFWRFGPTELRMLLVIGNLALLWKPTMHFMGGLYRLFDVGGAIGLIGMAFMLIFFTLQNTVRLYREERIS
jgi:archaetidylinositol phosphate synthase